MIEYDYIYSQSLADLLDVATTKSKDGWRLLQILPFRYPAEVSYPHNGVLMRKTRRSKANA